MLEWVFFKQTLISYTLQQISKGLADDLLKPSKDDNGTETMRTAVELCRKCIEYSGKIEI